MKYRLLVLGLTLITFLVATPDSSAQRRGNPAKKKVEAKGPWHRSFRGALYETTKNGPVGYSPSLKFEKNATRWTGKPVIDKITVSSGDGVKSRPHEAIALQGFEIAFWDFGFDSKINGDNPPKSLVVGYQKITLGKDYLPRRESKVFVYRDANKDGVIEKSEKSGELAIPEGSHPSAAFMKEGDAYIRLHPNWGSQAKDAIATYFDTNGDFAPDSLDSKPLRMLTKEEAKACNPPRTNGFAPVQGYSRTWFSHVESNKRYSIRNLIFPPKEHNPIKVYISGPPLAGDDILELFGSENTAYSVSDNENVQLANGMLDAEGRAKAKLSRALVEGEALTLSIPKTRHSKAFTVQGKDFYYLSPAQGPLISVDGEEKVVIRGRNLKEVESVALTFAGDHEWACEILKSDSDEIWIKTPNISSVAFPAIYARLWFFDASRSKEYKNKLSIRLKQGVVPHVEEAEFRYTLGAHSMSVGKKQLLAIWGRNLNEHTRVEIAFGKKVFPLELKYYERGTFASALTPKLLGMVAQGAKGHIFIWGAKQKRKDAHSIPITSEVAQVALDARSINGKLLPSRGRVTVYGRNLPHSTQLFYRDTEGIEHAVGTLVDARSPRSVELDVRRPDTGSFPPNSIIEFLVRDAAAQEGGVPLKIKVGDFPKSKLKWVSSLKLAEDGSLIVICRGDKNLMDGDFTIQLNHRGKNYSAPFLGLPRQGYRPFHNTNLPSLVKHCDDPILHLVRELAATLPKIDGLKKGDKVTISIGHEFQVEGRQTFERTVE